MPASRTANHRAIGALLETAPEFLDGENHAGERRVEGSGDARRAAGQKQGALAANAAKPAGEQHQSGADLDAWAFTADGRAADQQEDEEKGLADRHPHRDHVGAGLRRGRKFVGGDDLGMPEPWAPLNQRMVT